MRIQHILWDWNGTLLDDSWLCLDIANDMLGARGLPRLSMARYRQIFDFPVIRYYERMGFDLAREPFEAVAREFIETYERRRHEARLHSDALITLERLRERRLTQSILSNYPHKTLEEILVVHGIRHHFHDVVGSDDIYAHGKQERGLRWLQAQGWSPGTAMMVGDTVHDFEVACFMGTKCALVATGSHSRERLEQTGAAVFASLSDFTASDAVQHGI